MCFNYSIGGRKKKSLNVSTNAEYIELILGRYPQLQFVNGFENPKMQLLTKHGISEFNWGLIPSWIKNKEDAMKIRVQTLNAVSETMFEKPSFKESVRKRRCLVPASGFFEWRHEGKNTYPYYISLKHTDLFFFAGIYDQWTDRTNGQPLSTYSILTTEANPFMATIHNTKKRMPVIIRDTNVKDWLGEELNDSDILTLCRPLDQDDMEAHTIRKIKPSQTTEEKEQALQPYFYPELIKNELF